MNDTRKRPPRVRNFMAPNPSAAATGGLLSVISNWIPLFQMIFAKGAIVTRYVHVALALLLCPFGFQWIDQQVVHAASAYVLRLGFFLVVLPCMLWEKGRWRTLAYPCLSPEETKSKPDTVRRLQQHKAVSSIVLYPVAALALLYQTMCFAHLTSQSVLQSKTRSLAVLLWTLGIFMQLDSRTAFAPPHKRTGGESGLGIGISSYFF